MNHVLFSDMVSPRVRILGIAPYQGMKHIMENLAAERNDIDLDVYVGDMDRGVDIALKSIQSNYDILVSRGGTARMLEQASSLPVIEVEISTYDILRSIKLSESYLDRLAIIGFPNITANAHILCELMHYRIDIFTIHSQEEVSLTLAKLRDDGYSMILCDNIAYITAQKMKLNAMLITSGPESVSAALDQAVNLFRTCSRMIAESRFYQDILRDSSQQILVMKENGELIFSTVRPALLEETVALLTPEIPDVIKKKVVKFFRNVDQTLYSCICRSLSFAKHRYAIFYLTSSSVPILSGKYGIQYSSQKEIEDAFFNRIYNVTSIDTKKLNEVSFPVLLVGETGTGKEQAAGMIYSRSRLRANPLITVSCELLNDRSWNFLVNHYNSPLNDNNNTIFLKNVTALPEDRFRQLLSTMIDTSLCKRNRVIFSCEIRPGQCLPSEATELVNLLSWVTYFLKPTRERPEDMPSLCALYLNTVNQSMANQIIGLEPEALRLLQEYSWPYNYTQFRRILNELSLITSSSYIQEKDVRLLLEKERELSSEPTAPSMRSPDGTSCYTMDLSRPLGEITLEIIQLVLKENGGNQSAAAKQLGIGRSTLWRYLK